MRGQRSLVLDSAVRGVAPLVAVFSVYLLFAGHNAPGGGFIAGLVASAGLVLRFVASGLPSPRPIWLRADALIGAGLLLAVLVAMAGWLDGGAFLDMKTFDRDLPVLGRVKTTTGVIFDVGIYLVVIGTMVAILDGLGSTDSSPGSTAEQESAS